MSTLTLPGKNGSSAFSPAEAWLTTSVQKFFSTINWEDNPPEVQEIRVEAVAQEHQGPVSLTLSVQQFFASVNWDGTAIAAAVPVEQSVLQPESTDLTLDAFSDLF